ncbi:hypothetical protein [Bradyrhizobium embrapense]|uniref:hypothetical protein n=1 Tax=Bradyrhizobium embrapense TaxID=630921 RepID=UPI00067C7697|nr:hypothetical protein [Bradyrhizobium embrapense]
MVMNPGASTIMKDYARKECIASLMTVEHAGGKDVAALVIDAHLQAIASYLVGSIGREKTYDVFSRFADEVIKPTLPAGGPA